MNKIITTAKSMATNIFEIISESNKSVNHKVVIDCSHCEDIKILSLGAIYKQAKRGHNKYICPSCSQKIAWDKNKKELASKKSFEKWKDPDYAGTIIGKAISSSIRNN